MLRSIEALSSLAIHATDGELGRVTECYFDDETWTVRYLVVRTGSWFSGRDVLLTPAVVTEVDWSGGRVNVALTMDQVRESPDVSTDRPVSRLQEIEYLRYYDQPPYWMLGAEVGGAAVALDAAMRAAAAEAEAGGAPPPTHLRSSREVRSYHVDAADGPIGHVKDFLVDCADWRIACIVVDPSRWKFNDEVVVEPSRVARVSWGERSLHLRLPREAVRTAPHYTGPDAVTPGFLDSLRQHYDGAGQ
ncbi:MAG: PRC-barrel domain-containing protein [Vicinamibacterales bacterium]